MQHQGIKRSTLLQLFRYTYFEGGNTLSIKVSNCSLLLFYSIIAVRSGLLLFSFIKLLYHIVRRKNSIFFNNGKLNYLFHLYLFLFFVNQIFSPFRRSAKAVKVILTSERENLLFSLKFVQCHAAPRTDVYRPELAGASCYMCSAGRQAGTAVLMNGCISKRMVVCVCARSSDAVSTKICSDYDADSVFRY